MSDNQRRSLSLAQQGVMLVALLLACEFSFIGVLTWLLSEAEAEAGRQEHARQVSAKAGRLVLLVYDTGDAVGRYARSLQLGTADGISASKEEVPEIIAWLKNEFKDNEEATRLLEKIDKNIAICLPVISDIQSKSSALAEPGEKEVWNQKRAEIQPVVNELVKDIPAVIAISNRIEALGPEQERETRRITALVLVAGVVLNVLMVALVAYLFTNRITGRLDSLAENIARMKDGRGLKTLPGGKDEIATVDKVIQETAVAMRKEMAMLKAQEARVKALIENLPVGIAVVNDSGTIEYTNSTMENSFKYSGHQLLGKRLSRLLAADAGAAIDLDNIEFSTTHEFRALRRDGSTFPAEFTMAEVDMEGEAKTLAMVMDASEKFEIKKRRQAFISMVRTELKDPLTQVAGFFNKLNATVGSAVSAKAADTTKLMQQNIERLIVLLNDLFDMDKLESGKVEIEPAQEKLAVIFERSVNAVSVFAQQHEIHVQVNACTAEVYVDANRIVQVLVNLLSNAIKFSPPGSVVTVATRQSPAYLEIGVIDHGRGIPKAHLDSVFIAYRQVEAGDASKKGGTGLGLAICKAIMKAHGGEIGVNSEEGKGSVFWLKIPLVPLKVQ